MVIAAATLYAAVIAVLYFQQRLFVFPAPHPVIPFPSEKLGFHRLPDGGPVVLYRPGPAEAPTVVYFHGNGEQLADAVPLADAFGRSGLGFLAIEYPGYGFSPGSPSEDGLYAAADAGLKWLRTQSSGQVVLMGRSLGTGVASEMARRGHGERLVLVAAFTSIPDVAARSFPLLPVRWLVRDRFDTLSKAPSIQLPVLLVHGTADEVVPFDMGEKLARTFPHAELFVRPRAHHNDVLEESNAGLERIIAFARQAGQPGTR